MMKKSKHMNRKTGKVQKLAIHQRNVYMFNYISNERNEMYDNIHI